MPAISCNLDKKGRTCPFVWKNGQVRLEEPTSIRQSSVYGGWLIDVMSMKTKGSRICLQALSSSLLAE